MTEVEEMVLLPREGHGLVKHADESIIMAINYLLISTEGVAARSEEARGERRANALGGRRLPV